MTTATLTPPAAAGALALDAARAPATSPTTPAHPPRYDIYAPIHRALRLFMTDTLGRLGWLDCGDPIEVQATLDQLGALLHACHHHLQTENRLVHPFIEARRPAGTQRIAEEHVQHEEHIAALQAEAAALRAAPSALQALRLYRHLALFIAENFQHMQVEETTHNHLLWAAYGDEEILALEQRILAALDPAFQALLLRWLVPSMPPADRAEFLGGLREQMPPEAFGMVMDAARAALDDTAWAKLARALGVAPVPGLVAA